MVIIRTRPGHAKVLEPSLCDSSSVDGSVMSAKIKGSSIIDQDDFPPAPP